MIQSNVIVKVDDGACLDVTKTLKVHHERLMLNFIVTFLLAFLVFILFSKNLLARAILSTTILLGTLASIALEWLTSGMLEEYLKKQENSK